MDIVIRKVREEDLPMVVDIKVKGWQTAYEGIISDEYLSNMDNEYEKRIARMKATYRDNGFIVAEDNGEIVGFCRYVYDNSFSPQMQDIDCELMAIYVKPNLKYSGIGSKMFNYVVDEFKNMQKSKMIIWCLKDNEPSKRFYTKMGGRIVDEKIVQIGDNNYTECGFLYDI